MRREQVLVLNAEDDFVCPASLARPDARGREWPVGPCDVRDASTSRPVGDRPRAARRVRGSCWLGREQRLFTRAAVDRRPPPHHQVGLARRFQRGAARAQILPHARQPRLPRRGARAGRRRGGEQRGGHGGAARRGGAHGARPPAARRRRRAEAAQRRQGAGRAGPGGAAAVDPEGRGCVTLCRALLEHFYSAYFAPH